MQAALAPLVTLLTATLNAIYEVVRDYGVAIVLLTLAVRIAMLPLTIKQTQAMHDMQRLQPQLKALQEKYKKDKQKLQEEMMKLYQEHKVNPLGGCLPMLLQLPVMFALFMMLRNAESFSLAAGAKPSFWILLPDLTGSAAQSYAAGLLNGLPYATLVALMVATTYLSSVMLSKEPQQKRMMLMMSGFMAFIGWSLPAGLLLYWLTTNLFTLVQQWIMMRGKREGGGA